MSCFNIVKLNATNSTNDDLKLRFRKGHCYDGDLIWSLEQTAGRGQSDKKWISQKGKNLTFSIFKQFEGLTLDQGSLIVCATALSMVKALRSLNCPEISVKWPNDILSGTNKICGILIENVLRSENLRGTIIGIGLNVNQTNFWQLPNATSLRLELNQKFDLNRVLECVTEAMGSYFERCKSDYETSILKEYCKQLYGLNKRCKFALGGTETEAVLLGISPQGKIEIRFEDGQTKCFGNDEISMLYPD